MNRLITYCYEDKSLKVNRFIMNIDADIINKINALVEEANDAFSKSPNLLECIFYFGDAGQNWFRTNVDNSEETFGTGDGDVILAIRDDFIFSDEDRFFGEYSEDFEFHVTRDNFIYWTASYEGRRLEFETVWIPYWYFCEKIENIPYYIFPKGLRNDTGTGHA